MLTWIAQTQLYTRVSRQFTTPHSGQPLDNGWLADPFNEPRQRRSGPAWEDRIIRAPGQI